VPRTDMLFYCEYRSVVLANLEELLQFISRRTILSTGWKSRFILGYIDNAVTAPHIGDVSGLRTDSTHQSGKSDSSRLNEHVRDEPPSFFYRDRFQL
jgi:hypothetical protein